METVQTNASATEKEVFIKMVVSYWQIVNNRVSDLFNKLSDEELAQYSVRETQLRNKIKTEKALLIIIALVFLRS